MTDVELCAQMTLMKALVEHMYRNAFLGNADGFDAFMDELSKRFRFGLQAPEHATAEDAEWIQTMQTQVLKDAEKFRRSILATIRPGGGAGA